MDKKFLANFLDSERSRLGNISLAELARRLGFSQTMIWRWSKKKMHDYPSVEDLEAIARFKGTGVIDLMITELGFEPPKMASDIESRLDSLPTRDLSRLSLTIAAILNSRQAEPEEILLDLSATEMRNFGLWLEDSLKRTRLSDSQAADKVGVTTALITTLVRKKPVSITLEAFGKIAKLIRHDHEDFSNRTEQLRELIKQPPSSMPRRKSFA